METIPNFPTPPPIMPPITAPPQPLLWGDPRVAVPREPWGPPTTDVAQDPKFPGIGISIVWIVMYFALQVVLSIPVLLIAALLDPTLRDQVTSGDVKQTQTALLDAGAVPIMAGLVLSGIVTIGILWLHLRKKGRHQIIGLFARSRLSTGTTLVYGIGLMVGALVLSGVYNALVLKGEDSQADTTAIIEGLDSPAALILGFLAIAIIAPVVEELLFRGYLQTALAKRMKPWMAIAVSSLVFGAIHMQPKALPVLAVLGAVFGYLYHRTGSLKVNIALHMVNNALAFLALVIASTN